MRLFIRRLLALLLTVIIALLPSFSFAVKPSYDESEETVLKSRESYTKVVEINGKDMIYFAQNSPEWDAMRIDDSRKSFGKNYCSILALANALANCVSYEDLMNLETLARLPFRVDSTHANYTGGYEKNYKFIISRNCDVARFLPVVIASITTGNNKYYYHDTQISSHYSSFFEAFGLVYSKSSSLDVCYEALRNGAVIITCTGGYGSPLAPKYGHFFVLAGIDDQYVYCIDSIHREDYPDDKHHVIELLEPGVFRYAIEDTDKMNLFGTKYIAYPKEGCPCYSPELLEQIIKESNDY